MGRRAAFFAGTVWLCLLFALVTCAMAENGIVLEAGVPGQAVTVYGKEQRRGIILSLPGCWDAASVCLKIEGQDSFFLGDRETEIRPGEPVDLTDRLGKAMTIYDRRKSRLGTLTVYRGSAIPALFLTVDGRDFRSIRKSKEHVITEGQAVIADPDGSIVYSGRLTQLKGRGNSTFLYDKKPYQIKLAGKAGPDGMNPAKTWVLLANWTDISLLRNRIVLDMSADIGVPHAVDCRQTDVWVNGEYQGLYLMTEKIQIKTGRINIRDLEEENEKANENPPETYELFRHSYGDTPLLRGYRLPVSPEDITGGYILSIEKFHRLRDYKLAGFRTADRLSIRIVEPTYPAEEEVIYLAELFGAVHRAAQATDGTDSRTGKKLWEMLDRPSFVRRYLMEEWTKNYDFSGGSQFLYKDSDSRDPLIYAGPNWDYDLSFGNMTDRGFSSTGAYVTAMSRNPSNFYWLLSQHDDFAEETRRVWQEVFRPAAAVLLGEKEPAEGQRLRSMEQYAEEIRLSAEMNYIRWPAGTATAPEAGRSFENANQYLQKWIRERTAWMDQHCGAAGRTDKKQK